MSPHDADGELLKRQNDALTRCLPFVPFATETHALLVATIKAFEDRAATRRPPPIRGASGWFAP